MDGKFNPSISLDRGEQAQLLQCVATPGYKILNRIMRAEVDKFFLALLNTRAGLETDVLAAHKLAKAAAQFYEGVTERINEELIQFQNAPMSTDRPIDPTAAILDLGEYSREDI